MLSQKITLLSLELANTGSHSRQEVLHKNLRNSIKKMSSNHEILVSDLRAPGFFESGINELREIYFNEPEDLDDKTTEYLRQASLLANESNVGLDNQRLKVILESTPKLLVSLDKAVNANQLLAEEDSVNLQVLIWIMAMVIISLIFLVALLIFRPTISNVEQSAIDLEKTNKDLEDSYVNSVTVLDNT